MIQVVNMTSLIYLIKIRPFDVNLLNSMEILNECANIISVYLMITFTDVIAAEDTEVFHRRRNMAGNFFITFLLGLISFHIGTLLAAQIKTFKKICTKKNLKMKYANTKAKFFGLRNSKGLSPVSISISKKTLKRNGRYIQE